MSKKFNFEIIPVKKKLKIGKNELLSKSINDNIYYGGSYKGFEDICFITNCNNCNQSFFKIRHDDFKENRISDLFDKGYLTREIAKKNELVIIKDYGSEIYYRTVHDCTALYTQIMCQECQTIYFMILGFGETQPTLYKAQVHGIWKINKYYSRK